MSDIFFRKLYDSILEYKGYNACNDIIFPFIEAFPFGFWPTEFLQKISTKNDIPKFTQEISWSFYSFHRFNEILLLSFQKPKFSKSKDISKITLDQYIQIMTQVGLEVCQHKTFDPIWHQIVEVEYHQDDEKDIEIVLEIWPACKLKNLVMSRAGCKVIGGKNKINKNIAENYTLYWSHWRLDKKYNDQSLAWGSNSQWRTNFRRDYVLDKCLIYNHDADIIISDNQYIFADEGIKKKFDKGYYNQDFPNFTNYQIIELITNRSLIFSNINNIEVYPYHFGYVKELT